MAKGKKKALLGATHIVLLLDRSGSMQSVRDDTVGSYNSYLADQQAVTADAALWYLTLFGGLDIDRRNVATPIADVSPLTDRTYIPAGTTPLYDAIGMTLAEVEPRVGASDRVVFVVLTDGEENASREWTHAAVTKRIAEIEARLNWSVVYLGSTPSAVEIGRGFGLAAGNVSWYDAREGAATLDCLSQTVSAYRSSSETRSTNLTAGIGSKATSTP